VHYVDVGIGSSLDATPDGAILRVSNKPLSERALPTHSVELLSRISVERLATTEGSTWLDKQLLAKEPALVRDQGFGGEVWTAQAVRRQWLIAQGHAEEGIGMTVFRSDLFQVLEQRELRRAADHIARQTGLEIGALGQRGTGTLSRKVELVSGDYGMVQRGREFALAPWKPGFDRMFGRQLTWAARKNGIEWSVGRGREGPAIY
jgi:hypothetical protein